MLKQHIEIILIFIGILSYLFFRNYSGTIVPYPFLWFIIGIVVAIIGIILFLGSKSRREKRIEKSNVLKIRWLKENGRRITVGFDDYKIVSNKYYEERYSNESFGWRAQMYDAVYAGENSMETTTISQSRIVYEDKRTKQTYVSPLILEEETTLRFLLYKQKYITIYKDEYDADLYYFDLEFLHNHM